MIVKQGEIRANIKKYFDIAYEGEYILVPRKDNKNVVIISEDIFEKMRQFSRLMEYAERIPDKSVKMGNALLPTVLDSDEINNYLGVNDIRTENINRLQAFRRFSHGWNGYDAEAFDPSLIDKVSDIIDAQDIQPEIFPTALGAIQLEYENSRGDHMEIEISSEDKASVFIVLKTGQTFEDVINADSTSIKNKVVEFYG